jgi:COMPASS component SWD2
MLLFSHFYLYPPQQNQNRKFRGHSGPVNDISLCPGEDLFLTSSTDRTVRLWNIQQAGCLAQMELPPDTEGQPHAVFDSTGMVFAVMAGMAGGHGHYVHLYDARNYSGGAFSELQVLTTAVREAMTTHRVSSPPAEPLTFNSLKFNLSGNRMLAQSDQGLAVVLDGYEGTVQRIFQSESSSRGTVSCFTPDDQSLLMGAEDGTINCWNIQSGIHVKQLKGNTGPVRAIDCNPKYQQIASSCTSTW